MWGAEQPDQEEDELYSGYNDPAGRVAPLSMPEGYVRCILHANSFTDSRSRHKRDLVHHLGLDGVSFLLPLLLVSRFNRVQ